MVIPNEAKKQFWIFEAKLEEKILGYVPTSVLLKEKKNINPSSLIVMDIYFFCFFLRVLFAIVVYLIEALSLITDEFSRFHY